MILLEQIISFLSPKNFFGNRNQEINGICAADYPEITSAHLLWVSDKNLNLLSSISCGNIICSEKALHYELNNLCSYIIVENPRLAFQKVLTEFFVEKQMAFISNKSIIDESVIIGKNVSIGHNTVIEKNCVIGDNVFIGHNNTILANTIIGNGVKIGNNNAIGGVGFGYEKNEEGLYDLIPHIGSVKIDDFVEIGNCTCIDRAVLGYTLLSKNCKIDNLVHISHGVVIGENSLIIANSMIAGSVIIGKSVWVAPSVSVLNKTKIGDNATIGMGAVVLKNVDSNTIMIGNPAKELIRNK